MFLLALLVLDDLIVIARGRGDKADEEAIFSGHVTASEGIQRSTSEFSRGRTLHSKGHKP